MQVDLAGRLGLPEGRYLARSGETDEEADREVLVVQALGAPAPRRRRRARRVEPGSGPEPLPLTRVTVVGPEETGGTDAAAKWLEALRRDDDGQDTILAGGLARLNAALHALRAAGGRHYPADVAAPQALRALAGYGSGEQVAEGLYQDAIELPLEPVRRKRRDLRPEERIAGALAGREPVDVCEDLISRARADLDARRVRAAALQLRVGIEALLRELHEALVDPGHTEDMATLEARREELVSAANVALRGELDDEQAEAVREVLELCERVLRRRRVLRG